MSSSTTTNNIHRIAAQWIVNQLPSRSGDNIVDRVERTGLGVLNVKELKSLEVILNSLLPIMGETSRTQLTLPSTAKKQKRVDYLRRFFFRDEGCTIVNDQLLQVMQSQTTGTSVARRITSTSAASAATSVSENGNNSCSNQQTSQQQSGLTMGNAADFNAFAYYLSQFAPPDSSSTGNLQLSASLSSSSTHPVINNYNPWDGILPPSEAGRISSQIIRNNNNTTTSLPNNNTSTMMNGSNHNCNNRNVPSQQMATNGYLHQYQQQQQQNNNNDNDNNNQGISADPDSLPQNPTETLLLSQLSQMGFGRQEILDGIRQSENENPTTDEIMMLLIERREEAEEARRMDEVRLRSEEQTQGEINRREQTVQDSIASATTGEDLMIIFPESWVLKVLMDDGHDDSRDITKNPNGRHQRLISTIMNESRNDFVEFLQLEKKARKWYGFVLPSDYFNKVGTRLKNEPQIDWLGAEREKLRCGLYELKEQEKGEPKIFSDVYKTGISNKKEIIVIDDD
mmetsp:Transcript_61578/g.69761  ORF Transcript_61578/g.69761 Transcript_61578/m.69761 type:complete len:512 (-) Transcript_61578:207-1742(-)